MLISQGINGLFYSMLVKLILFTLPDDEQEIEDTPEQVNEKGANVCECVWVTLNVCVYDYYDIYSMFTIEEEKQEAKKSL